MDKYDLDDHWRDN